MSNMTYSLTHFKVIDKVQGSNSLYTSKCNIILSIL